MNQPSILDERNQISFKNYFIYIKTYCNDENKCVHQSVFVFSNVFECFLVLVFLLIFFTHFISVTYNN